MVKEPRLGRVKTRLARDIGAVRATWWFRHQVAHLLRRIDDPRWQVVLAVAPDRAVDARAFPTHLARITQGGGNLGDRMARVFDAARGPTLIIGADIPGVDRAAIADCLSCLRSHDAVLGPALDGGFWAIGLRHPGRRHRTLFQDVRWSSEHALSDTEATMQGLSIAYGPPLRDVDGAADL